MELKLPIAAAVSTTPLPFNRTLWNWNRHGKPTAPFWIWPLIEPYGIEIKKERDKEAARWAPLIRTLWNWNSREGSGCRRDWTSFNRTLWNWNTGTILFVTVQTGPLIEPYGIEIAWCSDITNCLLQPLIEPYGIEILHAKRSYRNIHNPLIEPYGIEIRRWVTESLSSTPLIEPYGIEITIRQPGSGEQVPQPLIEPYGIEIPSFTALYSACPSL